MTSNNNEEPEIGKLIGIGSQTVAIIIEILIRTVISKGS